MRLITSYLQGMLCALAEGTVHPDLSVILVTGGHAEICETGWSVRLLQYTELLPTGMCRNIITAMLCELHHAGRIPDDAICICQDADDYPSTDRLEYIRGIFTRFPDRMLLNHSYVSIPRSGPRPESLVIPGTEERLYFSEEYFDTYFGGGLENVRNITSAYGYFPDRPSWPVIDGAWSAPLRLFLDYGIRWPTVKEMTFAPHPPGGADYEFCMRTTHRFNKSVISNRPCYWYRSALV